MLDQQRVSNHKTNRPLIITLVILILIIIALTISVIITKNVKTTDIRQSIVGLYDESLPNHIKSVRVSDAIKDKLNSESDYTTENAINDYDSLYQEFTGELKIYIAIDYAFYIFNSTQDIERAAKILDIKEHLTTDTELDYYTALATLYARTKNQDKVDEYQKIIDELIAEPIFKDGAPDGI